MKCRVRDGFFVHLSEDKVVPPGTILDLTPSEFERYSHQVELVDQPQKELKREPKI